MLTKDYIWLWVMAVPVPNAHIIDHAGAHASQMSFSIGLHELQSIILITR